VTVTDVVVRPLVAADVMSAPALSVAPDATVWAAWSVMTGTGLRHLVVTVEGRCVGVIDDRTVFAQWPMGPLALRRRTVASIMRAPTTCVLPGTDLQSIAAVMVRNAVDAVPVIDSDGELVGIVTGGDIAAAVARHGATSRLGIAED